jgi:hypothetical protein
MKYYLHDTNSFNDEKITEVYMRYGYEGLGLFYTFLEKIAGQEKPVKTEVLKSQLGVGKRLNKCWEFLEEIGLISTKNGESFNEQLLNFSEKYKIKKEKTKEKIKQWRENQKVVNNVTSYKSICNAPKVKESKVNRNKKEKINKKEKPTLDEVTQFITTQGYAVDPQRFFDYYSANGWRVGKNPMKDWKAAVRMWNQKNNNEKPTQMQRNIQILNQLATKYEQESTQSTH